jgi:hypothetical protein
VSAGSLVVASTGMAYHIWRQRMRLRQRSRTTTGRALMPAGKIDVETEEVP